MSQWVFSSRTSLSPQQSEQSFPNVDQSWRKLAMILQAACKDSSKIELARYLGLKFVQAASHLSKTVTYDGCSITSEEISCCGKIEFIFEVERIIMTTSISCKVPDIREEVVGLTAAIGLLVDSHCWMNSSSRLRWNPNDVLTKACTGNEILSATAKRSQEKSYFRWAAITRCGCVTT